MAPATASSVRLGRDVVILPVDDGSARLLDLDGSFHALSRSGYELLAAALQEGPAAAADRVAALYGVEAARVRADLDRLLADLGRKGLIREPGEPAGTHARIRAARACIRTFARSPLARSAGPLLIFARLSFAWFGWSETVAAWAEILPAAPPSATPPDADASERIDARVRTLGARLPGIDCKERALAAWILLAREGVPASLVVGVHLYPLTGHCWCEAGGRTLTDDALYCRAYTPVARYEIGASGFRADFMGAGLPA